MGVLGDRRTSITVRGWRRGGGGMEVGWRWDGGGVEGKIINT